MAYHALAKHFAYLFSRLNPSTTFEQTASREYASIKGLIENHLGPAASLSPTCFLQGSYRQQTAIYTINDVDIVALCELWQPGSSGGYGFGRDDIFRIIAAPLLADGRYRDKVRYGPQSMCIKVDLGVKVEILPVVYKSGNSDSATEPFRLYRPEIGQWEDGYARYHQQHLSAKNAAARTGANFIPTIKLIKHLRSRFKLADVSFHIECLLYSLDDGLFTGGPADCIMAVLSHIAGRTAADWYSKVCRTPCGDRDIFTGSEWTRESWLKFHEYAVLWANTAILANGTNNHDEAIKAWRLLLGDDFPVTVG